MTKWNTLKRLQEQGVDHSEQKKSDRKSIFRRPLVRKDDDASKRNENDDVAGVVEGKGKERERTERSTGAEEESGGAPRERRERVGTGPGKERPRMSMEKEGEEQAGTFMTRKRAPGSSAGTVVAGSRGSGTVSASPPGLQGRSQSFHALPAEAILIGKGPATPLSVSTTSNWLPIGPQGQERSRQQVRVGEDRVSGPPPLTATTPPDTTTPSTGTTPPPENILPVLGSDIPPPPPRTPSPPLRLSTSTTSKVSPSHDSFNNSLKPPPADSDRIVTPSPPPRRATPVRPSSPRDVEIEFEDDAIESEYQVHHSSSQHRFVNSCHFLTTCSFICIPVMDHSGISPSSMKLQGRRRT